MRTNLLIATLCLYAFVTPVQAGQLNNIETAALKSPSKSKKSSNRSSRSDKNISLGEEIKKEIKKEIAIGVAEVVVKVTIMLVGSIPVAVLAGGAFSHERYSKSKPEPIETNDLEPDDTKKPKNGNFQKELYRVAGDPILPMFRASAQWLNSGSDINAQLNRIEAGYSFLGMSYSQNILNENGDQLKLSNTLIHYRMTFHNNFSWDLAYGRGKMNGNQKHDGSVFAMPMRLRFNPNWHFEYYPVWSSYKGGSLAEHQFSFNYHYKHIGTTLGYKTWSAGKTSIDGLFGGIYLSF
jgi:hypothetical protein